MTRTLLTTQSAHGLRMGQIISFSGDAARVRRKVAFAGGTFVEIDTWLRPSKGYRKHVRREKAVRRSATQ